VTGFACSHVYKKSLESGGGASGGGGADHTKKRKPSGVSRAFPSLNRSILTEIYLRHACSGQEIAAQSVEGAHEVSPKEAAQQPTKPRKLVRKPPPVRAAAAAGARVSPFVAFLACIGSPCLRHCVHGAPIGGRDGEPRHRRRAAAAAQHRGAGPRGQAAAGGGRRGAQRGG
jgi:hypothetical protein